MEQMDISQPEPPPTLLHITPYEVAARLGELGISREPLELAVLQGDLQRRLATPDDYYSAAGFSSWNRMLRVLREELRRDAQWHRGDFLRIPVVFNPDESVAIGVASGDWRTGEGDDPRGPTTNPKGPATIEAVEISGGRGQLDFPAEGVDLWYLVYRLTDDGLWAELSRPRDVSDAAEISGWSERILIGRIDPDSPLPAVKTKPSESNPEIAVDVRRKSA